MKEIKGNDGTRIFFPDNAINCRVGESRINHEKQSLILYQKKLYQKKLSELYRQLDEAKEILVKKGFSRDYLNKRNHSQLLELIIDLI